MFCPKCKVETEVVFLEESIDQAGVYKLYECTNCDYDDIREDLGKESLKVD